MYTLIVMAFDTEYSLSAPKLIKSCKDMFRFEVSDLWVREEDVFRVGKEKFVVWIPKSLVDQYKSLYEEFEVMNADGSVVVYSSGVVTEKSNENQ